MSHSAPIIAFDSDAAQIAIYDDLSATIAYDHQPNRPDTYRLITIPGPYLLALVAALAHPETLRAIFSHEQARAWYMRWAVGGSNDLTLVPIGEQPGER